MSKNTFKELLADALAVVIIVTAAVVISGLFLTVAWFVEAV